MGIYRYQPTSLIDEITIATTENGAERAYLHAGKNATEDQLHNTSCKLSQLGWECIPYILDGKPTLEVRGFDEHKKLRQYLNSEGLTQGPETYEKVDVDEKSLTEKLKARTLQLCSWFYLVGDLCYMKYGYQEGHIEDFLAGAFYGAGTGSVLLYGRNDQSDLQIRDIAREVKRFMQDKRLEVPDNCTLNHVLEDPKKGIAASTNEFFRRHPAEMMNAFFGVAGALITSSALRNKVLAKPTATMHGAELRELKKEGWWDVGLGTMTIASGALSALVEEKIADPNKPPPETLSARAWEFVQQHPLAIAGVGYMISTLCHAKSTYGAFHQAKRMNDTKRLASVPYRAAFVGANLIAEALMAVSSKGHGEGVQSDNTVDYSIYAIAADLITKQPTRTHNELIAQMSVFLADPKVLGGKVDEIAVNLRKQVDGMIKNPWSEKSKNKTVVEEAAAPVKTKEAAVAPTPDSKLTYSETITRKAEITPAPAFTNWKDKVASSTSTEIIHPSV